MYATPAGLAWRLADSLATEAEQAVRKARLRYCNDAGDLPTEEQIRLALQLRHEANLLFVAAMAEMREQLGGLLCEAAAARPAVGRQPIHKSTA